MRYLKPVLWMLCLWGMTIPAHSAPQRGHSHDLMTVLRAIDLVPNAAGLRALDPNVARSLVRIAEDRQLDTYMRRRAISFLSYFPTTESGERLQALGLREPQLRVRWMAIYAYVRIWGEKAPEKIRSFANHVLRDKEPLMREAVIRGLRHCPGKPFDALVQRHARHERNSVVNAAIRRFRKARLVSR
jgi:hypothetical protein